MRKPRKLTQNGFPRAPGTEEIMRKPRKFTVNGFPRAPGTEEIMRKPRKFTDKMAFQELQTGKTLRKNMKKAT